MGCDSWKAKLDTYLDGELPAEEMRAFAEHVRGCPTCAPDALARVQISAAFRRPANGSFPVLNFVNACKRASRQNRGNATSDSHG